MEIALERESGTKTQNQWISYFNRKDQIMISAPDVYRALNSKALKSLQKDFKSWFDWVVTSTRIIYNQNNESATVIHNFGSTAVKEKKIKVKIVRDISGTDFDKRDEKFLQALFNTKDSFKKICETLDELGEDKELNIWTPSQEGREERPSRSVGFYSGDDRFVVDAGVWVDIGYGRSRRVLSKSEPKARSK